MFLNVFIVLLHGSVCGLHMVHVLIHVSRQSQARLVSAWCVVSLPLTILTVRSLADDGQRGFSSEIWRGWIIDSFRYNVMIKNTILFIITFSVIYGLIGISQPRKGHTLLACSMVCNRSWHLPGVAPCSPYKRRGLCGSVCGYHASKRIGPLWIWRVCSFHFSFPSFTYNCYALPLF